MAVANRVAKRSKSRETAHLVARASFLEVRVKYGIAWLIGVPPVLIAAWFLLNHC